MSNSKASPAANSTTITTGTKRKKAPLSVTVSEPERRHNGTGGDGPVQLSWEGVKTVQKKIERCLELYMTQAEIVTALQVQSKIEPSLTCLVWQKLQEQNPHFFHVYNYYLRLKDHVTAFNYLVEQQALIQNEISDTDPSASLQLAFAQNSSSVAREQKVVVEVDITR